MTIANVKNQISGILDSDGLSIEVYFLLKTEDQYIVRSTDLEAGVQADIKTQFVDSLKTSITENEELSLLNISEADERKNVLYKYDLEPVPEKLCFMNTVWETDQFTPFNFGEDSLEDIEAILLVIGNADDQVVLYKHQYPIYLIKKKELGLIWSGAGNRFEKFNNEVLKLNPNFEFLYVGQTYYIKDIKLLERSFAFHTAIKNAATSGLQQLKDFDLVEDIEFLSARLDELSFSKKLLKATTNSLVLGLVPNADIINFAINHPKLKGKFKTSEDGTKFDLKTKASHTMFFKLMNDAFLKSQLTQNDYDSLAKDTLIVDET